jgi:MFS family permease
MRQPMTRPEAEAQRDRAEATAIAVPFGAIVLAMLRAVLDQTILATALPGGPVLGTAALFAITVFVPLCLETMTGATPIEAGLFLIPAMLGITVSTTLSGRSIARTRRHKRFPVAGLALMTVALGLLAALASERSRVATGIGLAVFGLGFAMVTQVLVIAVQNSVEPRELGVATATRGFFRALGGAVGAAVLGAVFAAQAGTRASEGAGLYSAVQSNVIDAVQTVFLVAAPLAVLALLAVLVLPELPLQTRAGPGGPPASAPTRTIERPRTTATHPRRSTTSSPR